jgi:DNA-binding transcriptional LysR family regulator
MERTMPVRLAEMRTFERVAAHESLAAAARELGLSPSTVSKQIRLLEERLDVRLLHRTTRRVTLTQAGRVYYERAQKILGEVEELEHAVRGLHAEPRGTLRVSAPQDFGRLYLCEAVGRFAAEHPHLRIEFEMTDRKVDVLEEGYDVAVRVARAASSTLVMKRLGTCPRVLCASPSYLATYGAPETPAALASHNCIEYDYAESNAWRFRIGGRTQMAAATGRLRANSGWALRSLALAGQGIALLPRFLVHEDLAAGRLAPVLEDALDADLDVMALLPPGRRVAAKSRAFVDFIAARLADERWWAGAQVGQRGMKTYSSVSPSGSANSTA